MFKMTNWWAIDQWPSVKKKEISWIIKLFHLSRGYSRVCQLIHSIWELDYSIVVDLSDLISVWSFIEIEMLWHAKHKSASNLLFRSIENWEFRKISSPQTTHNIEINHFLYQLGLPLDPVSIACVTPFWYSLNIYLRLQFQKHMMIKFSFTKTQTK